MEKNKCSLLLSSCDKYKDAWLPFFTLLDIMWTNRNMPVFMSTESADFSYTNINIKCLHPESLTDKKGRPISWSNRLKQAIEKIDSEYILLMLEDFFLQAPVRNDVVEDCIKWMNEDKKIGHIDFYNEPFIDRIERGEFSPVDPSYDYALNTLPGLWRKEFLLSIIRDEDPWDFEFYGTGRWRRTDIKIYTHRKEFPKVFDFGLNPALGYGIFRGKWLKKNQELFEQYGIDVNYDNLGMWEELPDLVAREREKNWLLHDFQKALKSPKALIHYVKCTYNVGKDKIAHIKQKYFNR